MVSAESAWDPSRLSRQALDKSNRHAAWRIFAVASASFAVVAFVTLLSVSGGSRAELEDGGAVTDSTSRGHLLQALEKSMDASIDNKVKSFLSAPSIAAVPIPDIGPLMEGKNEIHLPAYAKDSYLDRLDKEKRELEKQRDDLMDELRKQRQEVAIKATKDSIDYNMVHLQRAKKLAKKRQLELAQRAARAAAKEMRQATIAKQYAIHAEAVADERARQLDDMVDSDRLAALQRVKAKAAALAHSQAARGQAKPAAEIQHKVVMPEAAAPAGAVKAPVDGETKLQAYLREEKALKDKIKRAEQAVAKSDKSEEKAAGRGRASAEGSVVSTLAKTLYANKQTIAKDEKIAEKLKQEQDSLQQDMERLKRKNEQLINKKHSS